MKLEQVLPALRAGKSIRLDEGTRKFTWSRADDLRSERLTPEMLLSDGWTILEEPATDEALVAEMRRLSSRDAAAGSKLTAAAYSYCAEMLRRRSIEP